MPAWSPCTRARPTIAAPLLLLHFAFGTARRAHHSLTHSPPHPPPLPARHPRPHSLFLSVCSAMVMEQAELELLLLLAAAGQGQGRAWPWLAEARPPAASCCHRPLSGGSRSRTTTAMSSAPLTRRRQGPRVRIRNNPGFQMRSQDSYE
jgi:hypothetical protein